MRISPIVFNVDIVGTCNLRCPSCPIGNTDSQALPKGAMPIDKLDAVVKKAKKEIGPVSFHLFNWTEPLLHPKIGEAIEVVKRNNIPCHLSTNLNLSKHLEDVAYASPDGIRISVSGFSQDQYGVTHKEGDIEKVKINMIKLAELVKKSKASTELTVLFHRYLGNHSEEQEMRAFSEALGYTFEPVWAYMMPLEKTLAFAEDGLASNALSESDRDVIGRLALPLGEAIEISKSRKVKSCTLQSNQYALDLEANVNVCCAVYNSEERRVGNFLEESHEALQNKKYQNPICSTCMRHGLHVLATYGAPEEFDRIAMENVRRHYPGVNLEPTRPTQRAKLVGKVGRVLKRRLRAVGRFWGGK